MRINTRKLAGRLAAGAAVAAAALPVAASVALASTATVTIDSALTCADGSEFCYRPASQTVPAGTTVTVNNTTTAPHTLTRCTVAACGAGNTGDGPQNFDTGSIPANGSGQVTLTQPGTYVYYCTIHTYSVMHGSFTVTAASGPSSSTTTSNSTSSTGAPGAPMAVPAAGAGLDLRLGVLLAAAGALALAVLSRRRPSDR